MRLRTVKESAPLTLIQLDARAIDAGPRLQQFLLRVYLCFPFFHQFSPPDATLSQKANRVKQGSATPPLDADRDPS
jgi:hypothetical protein